MEKSLIEEVKDRIRIWNKNEEALCDLAALVYDLKSKRYRRIDISTATLFYKVKSNLEDPEIYLGYKGTSLQKSYGYLIDEINNLAKKYCEIDPKVIPYFMEIRSKNTDEYLFNSPVLNQSGNKVCWYDEPYNIIYLLSDEICLIKELLLSKIPKGTRIPMIDDIIKSKNISLDNLVDDEYYHYPNSIYPVVYRNDYDDIKIEKQKSIDAIKELFVDWKKRANSDKNDKYAMVKNISINNLRFLQNNDIIDFVKELSYNTDEYGIVALPAQINRIHQNIDYVFEFYESESYQNLQEEIKQNTDEFLIHDIINSNIYDIPKLIASKSFRISDENIDKLILALCKSKKISDNFINLVCNAIVNRSKTPKEYRKAKQYIKKIHDCLDPEKIHQQRQEFVMRLNNMNESLQEQVPGKTVIKSIKFQIDK